MCASSTLHAVGTRLTAGGLAFVLAYAAAPAWAQPIDDGFRRLDTGVSYRVTVHRALGFVRGIEQTSDGYLWFATSLGLARYDGLAFVFFDTSNTAEICDDHIVGLAKGKDDELWLVSERGGLVRRHAGRFTRHPFPDALGRGVPSCLALDAQGRVWVGTNQSGLFYFADGTWTHVHHTAEQPVASIGSIHSNATGELLVSAQGRWWRIVGTKLVPLPEIQDKRRSPTEILLQWMLPPNGPRVDDPVDPMKC